MYFAGKATFLNYLFVQLIFHSQWAVHILRYKLRGPLVAFRTKNVFLQGIFMKGEKETMKEAKTVRSHKLERTIAPSGVQN